MNTSRDMESVNDSEVVSPSTSKPQPTACELEFVEAPKGSSNSKIKKTTKRKKSDSSDTGLIPIGTNKYQKPPSIHEKYAARPDSLEHICLAQFAQWYETAPKNSKKQKRGIEMSEHEIVCPHLESPQTMPKFIELKDSNLGCMYLREGPQVIMFHKFDAEKDAHEFFYNELLFYFHWRSESELHCDDFQACLAKFRTMLPKNPKGSFIDTVKNDLFPEMNNVELARVILEEFPNDQRPTHIGDFLDNENEKEMKIAGSKHI